MLYGLPEEERKRISRQLAPNSSVAVVENSQGNILLGVRGPGTHQEGRLMPFPAGHPEYNHATGHLETPFQALSVESDEELGHPLYDERSGGFKSDVSDAYAVGMVRCDNGDFKTWHIATVFVIDSKRTDRELEEGYACSVDRYEHGKILFLPIDSKVLANFIIQRYPQLIDNGLGVLIVYGRSRFGHSWSENLVHKLNTDTRYETTITEGNPFK